MLQDHRIIEIGEGAGGALARFLASLGARVQPAAPERLSADLEGVSFLIDRRSTRQPSDPSCAQADLLTRHRQLIHVSITPFGRDAPRAAWTGNELIVSALGGALGLTGDADR